MTTDRFKTRRQAGHSAGCFYHRPVSRDLDSLVAVFAAFVFLSSSAASGLALSTTRSFRADAHNDGGGESSASQIIENPSSSQFFTHHSDLPLPDRETMGAGTTLSLPLTYTNDPMSVFEWFDENLHEDGCILGFDVESAVRTPWIRPRHFVGAATVQLATPKAALVVHLVREIYADNGTSSLSFRRSEACMPILQSILRDPQFVKVGCGVDADLVALQVAWDRASGVTKRQAKPMDAKSRFDLAGIILDDDDYVKRKKRGLKSLMSDMLGIDLPKNRTIATSDWSHAPLQQHQIDYAASDAWAGAVLAQKLAERDPETWGHESLMRTLLETERPFAEVFYKSKKRKGSGLSQFSPTPWDVRYLFSEVVSTTSKPDSRHNGTSTQ